MPTLTETTITEEEDDDEVQLVNGDGETLPSSSPAEKSTVAVVPKSPPTKATSGKRKAAKITPTSEPASKRKKQQAPSNQRSIASFFQPRKKPPPESPLAKPPTASDLTTSDSQQQQQSTNTSTSSKKPSSQERLQHRISATPTDSLASCGATDAPTVEQARPKPFKSFISQRGKSIPTKESLRDIVVGRFSPLPPTEPDTPQKRSAPAILRTDYGLLPNIIAPALIKRKNRTITDLDKSSSSIDAAVTETPQDSSNSTKVESTQLQSTELALDSAKVDSPSIDTNAIAVEVDESTKQDNSGNVELMVGNNCPNEKATTNGDDILAMEVVHESDTDSAKSVNHSNSNEDNTTTICVDLENMKECSEIEHVEAEDEKKPGQVTEDPDTISLSKPSQMLRKRQQKKFTSVVELLPDVKEGNDEEKPEAMIIDVDQRIVDASPTNNIIPERKTASDISPERQSRLAKVQTMKTNYCNKIAELVVRGRDGLEEETFELSLPEELPPFENSTTEFPNDAVPSLAYLVEGSRLPLSSLVSSVVLKLNESFQTDLFTSDLVAAKIKVVAKRECFLENPNNASTLLTKAGTKTAAIKTNVFEDENPDRMWRWEVISLDVFSDNKSFLADVKKARAARRKLRSYFKALSKLLLALGDIEKLLVLATTSQEKLDAAEAKVSHEENQALNFERELEKSRLAAEARKKKQKEETKKGDEKKQSAAQAREEQKKLKAAEREVLRRKKEEDKLRQKAEREELKRKQDEQKEKERIEREAKLKKQQGQLRSFFEPKRSSAAAKSAPIAFKAPRPKSTVLSEVAASVDCRPLINSSVNVDARLLFRKLSEQAVKSRKRRTRRVSIPVFVTAMSDDPFDAEPYLEQKMLDFPNKYKFLSFFEDYRPAYHGTWSKRSKIITGRNPFGKDKSTLDYENESEAEWEEGDDDIGEDVESNSPIDESEEAMDDEEGDPTTYNYEDGWMQRDDDFGSDIDEETKLLLQRKLQSDDKQNILPNGNAAVVPVCVIAPLIGGVPWTEDANASCDEYFEGFAKAEALNLIASHTGEWLGSCDLCLDAFPPSLVDEGPLPDDPNGAEETVGLPISKKGSSELSKDDLRTFARFVQYNTLPSKDKLLDEIKNVHKSLFSSRAQSARTLDAMASKKRSPDGAVFWEVKTALLTELGLEDLLDRETQPKAADFPSEKDATLLDPTVASNPLTNDEKTVSSNTSAANLLQSFLVGKKVN